LDGPRAGLSGPVRFPESVKEALFEARTLVWGVQKEADQKLVYTIGNVKTGTSVLFFILLYENTWNFILNPEVGTVY